MILIVDDLSENLLSLKRFLELHSFSVETASSGEEALKKVLKQTYALIILDVQMPGMDGFEVAETLTGFSRSKDTPIIFLTAVSIDKRFVTRGYASGGIDYIAKPVDPDILLLKVKTFYKIFEQKKALKDAQEQLKLEIEFRKKAEAQLNTFNTQLEQRVAIRTDELRQTNEMLERRNEELQQFAYVSSHDLKEPLRKIRIFSDILGNRFIKDNPEAREYLDKIEASSSRMTALIEDILNYSKLSSQNDHVPVDLNESMAAALSDLDMLVADKNAVITADKLPTIHSGQRQMHQLFLNLLGNALKFARPGVPPVIHVGCELLTEKSFTAQPVKDKPPMYCRISVQDNGIGFEERYLAKMFTIFQRLHTLHEYQGSGVGLSIVKKIVENHEGLVTAKSKPGEGATFIVILPIH